MSDDGIAYAPFAPQHVVGVIRLTSAEGWPTLAEDRERAVRVLGAPGAVTIVALDDGEIVGFGRALTDGEWVACLVDFVVDAIAAAASAAASSTRSSAGRGCSAWTCSRSRARRRSTSRARTSAGPAIACTPSRANSRAVHVSLSAPLRILLA
jgi:hypothetical protein